MQGGLLHRSHSMLMVFNPILYYLSPKSLLFQEPLIIETWNKCHWIWHALNPKYSPLKPFQCIFPSQNQQNVKFLPEILILQEPLIIETWNLCHGIQHTSNPKYLPLKPIQCIFPSQNQQNVKFLAVCWTPPDKKWKKTPSIWMGKSVRKGLKICTYRFLGMLIAMHYVRTLCEKYFLSYDGLSLFLTGRFRHRVLKHGVGVEWDARILQGLPIAVHYVRTLCHKYFLSYNVFSWFLTGRFSLGIGFSHMV